MSNLLKNLWKNDSGATAIEYALIVAMIAIVIVLTLKGVGVQLGDVFDEISETLSTALSGFTNPNPR